MKGITFSPIKGPEGNIEYLGFLSPGWDGTYEGDLAEVVQASHTALEEVGHP